MNVNDGPPLTRCGSRDHAAIWPVPPLPADHPATLSVLPQLLSLLPSFHYHHTRQQDSADVQEETLNAHKYLCTAQVFKTSAFASKTHIPPYGTQFRLPTPRAYKPKFAKMGEAHA